MGLSFEKGDIIEVTSVAESGWWHGICLTDKAEGWFPGSFVEPVCDFQPGSGDQPAKDPSPPSPLVTSDVATEMTATPAAEVARSEPAAILTDSGPQPAAGAEKNVSMEIVAEESPGARESHSNVESVAGWVAIT